VHFDGGASHSNFSAWSFKEGKLSLLNYSWELKYLSSFYNANALVFGIIGAKQNDQNAVPGKMMGLASFGTYSAKMEDWLKENEYFQDSWKSKSVFYAKAKESFSWDKNMLDQKDPFLHDILATMQYIFMRDFFNVIKDLQEQYKSEYLYYSGGSALNIVCNNKIVESGLFKQVYIPPCAEDSGLALGAAAYVEFLKHGSIEHHSSYLNNWGIEDYDTVFTNDDIKNVAEEIMQEKIIGLCNGMGEIGPRALGNRSIIALASSRKLADKVSIDKKGREWYRPIAPLMLARNLEYFTGIKDSLLSTYMLRDFEVLPEKRKEIEGVVHVNGSSRIQCINTMEENPFIYSLLDYLEKNYGVKALINTSFNKRGEPIVHTIEDALASAIKMKLDALVLNGKLNKL
jgi:carbamoyltransferase